LQDVLYDIITISIKGVGVYMGFILSNKGIDFGQTAIENIFINDFMPMANGTYVKVYLLGYKFATDREKNNVFNNSTIAKHLNIPLEDVLRAWDFWEEKGIILKHYNSDSEEDYTVEFLSLRQLYIDNNYKRIDSKGETLDRKYYNCTPEDLLEANKMPQIKEMFFNIDQIVRRQLTPNERMTVLEWIYNYNMDPDIILKAFEYSVEKRNVKNIRYVGGIIKNWYDNGVVTMEKLEEYLEKTDKKFIYYNKIFKALGFSFRQPSKAEKETMDVWIDEWKFPLDVILKACENSKNTSNPNINYINSILLAWKNDGITTVEEVEKKKEESKKERKTTSRTPKENKFQNFEQRFDKYTNEDLEKILGIKK